MINSRYNETEHISQGRKITVCLGYLQNVVLVCHTSNIYGQINDLKEFLKMNIHVDAINIQIVETNRIIQLEI